MRRDEWHMEMKLAMAESSNKLKCFIIGYTGETGKELMKTCFNSDKFSHVLLLGRRYVDIPKEMDVKCEQKQIDFEDLEASKDLLSGVDVGFCALGTTRGKAGKDGFIKVDRDYTLGIAELAKSAGVSQFHYISSVGANKDSWFLYSQIKGQVELRLSEMGFQHLFIYRPAVLMCDREERRMGERFMKFCCTPLFKLAPKSTATPTDLLARAAVNCTVDGQAPKCYHLLENARIYDAAEGKCPTVE